MGAGAEAPVQVGSGTQQARSQSTKQAFPSQGLPTDTPTNGHTKGDYA